MATKESIAIRVELIMNRLFIAMGRIAEATGVTIPTMPMIGNDPELANSYRLETIAMWAEDVARFFEPFGDGVSKDSEQSQNQESADEIPGEELSADMPAEQLPEIDDDMVGVEQEAFAEELPQDGDETGNEAVEEFPYLESLIRAAKTGEIETTAQIEARIQKQRKRRK